MKVDWNVRLAIALEDYFAALGLSIEWLGLLRLHSCSGCNSYLQSSSEEQLQGVVNLKFSVLR